MPWTVCECGVNVPPGKTCPVCDNSKETKKVAIAIDKYKVGVFETALKKGNFLYNVGKGITPDTLTIYVYTNNPKKLKRVVEKANIKATR